MRDSLKKSAADSPARGFEKYPRGSVVLCNACAGPIFKLEIGIALGDGCGRMAKAFKPLTLADLDALAARTNIDAGVRARLTAMTLQDRLAYVEKLHEVHAGDPMICPHCGNGFAQVISVEHHEVLDRSYTVELLTIPPEGTPPPIRGKQIGATKEWVH